MAYITKEQVKDIRETLKSRFPEFKFSLRGANSISLDVAVMSGPYAFAEGEEYAQINHYYPERLKHSDKLREIIDVCLKFHWDESDVQTDYFNCAYYFSISQGRWDKPYVIKE